MNSTTPTLASFDSFARERDGSTDGSKDGSGPVLGGLDSGSWRSGLLRGPVAGGLTPPYMAFFSSSIMAGCFIAFRAWRLSQ